jgi:hypothetical protein
MSFATRTLRFAPQDECSEQYINIENLILRSRSKNGVAKD